MHSVCLPSFHLRSDLKVNANLLSGDSVSHALWWHCKHTQCWDGYSSIMWLRRRERHIPQLRLNDDLKTHAAASCQTDVRSGFRNSTYFLSLHIIIHVWRVPVLPNGLMLGFKGHTAFFSETAGIEGNSVVSEESLVVLLGGVRYF